MRPQRPSSRHAQRAGAARARLEPLHRRLNTLLLRSPRWGPQTDVWSLGCVLHELITLKPPFEAQNLRSLVQKVGARNCKGASRVESTVVGRELRTVGRQRAHGAGIEARNLRRLAPVSPPPLLTTGTWCTVPPPRRPDL